MRTQRRRGPGKAKWIFLVLLLLAGGGYWFYRNYEPEIRERIEHKVNAGATLQKFKETRPLMGTTFAITTYAPDELVAKEAMAEAFRAGEAVNQACSDYLPDSDLTRLNSAEVGKWVRVSEDLINVLAYGLELAELTNGVFDPTLGAMTHLWRETRKTATLPSQETLHEVRAMTGWQELEIQQTQQLARRHLEGLRIDLGGIAKGYAADRMLDVLKAHGLKSSLVAAGGDVRCGEAPPNKKGWDVALKDSSGEVRYYITVSNCSVSTSGDLEQFVVIEGVRYSHIIDPATGLGLTRPVLATVIAPNGLMSDPLATTACINPSFFSGLSPATEIHSRIITANEVLFSRAFPKTETLMPNPKLPAPSEDKTTEEKPEEGKASEESG